jgi:hypothetical protein
MMSLSCVQRKEQVKSQSAKRKRQSHGKEYNYPGMAVLGLYFCVLHFAFCLLTCSSLPPATTALWEEVYC